MPDLHTVSLATENIPMLPGRMNIICAHQNLCEAAWCLHGSLVQGVFIKSAPQGCCTLVSFNNQWVGSILGGDVDALQGL